VNHVKAKIKNGDFQEKYSLLISINF